MLESSILLDNGVVNLHAFDSFDSITLWIIFNSSLCHCFWKRWHLKPLTLWYRSFREASGIILGHVSMRLVQVVSLSHTWGCSALPISCMVNATIFCRSSPTYYFSPMCCFVFFFSPLLHYVSWSEYTRSCVRETCNKRQETDHMWTFSWHSGSRREEVVKNALVSGRNQQTHCYNFTLWDIESTSSTSGWEIYLAVEYQVLSMQQFMSQLWVWSLHTVVWWFMGGIGCIFTAESDVGQDVSQPLLLVWY